MYWYTRPFLSRDYHSMSVTASSYVSTKFEYTFGEHPGNKRWYQKTQNIQTDTRPHLTNTALFKAAFNNGSRTNKTHPNIRRKRNEKREGGGRGGGGGGNREKKKKKGLQAFPEAVSQLNVLWSSLKRCQGLYNTKHKIIHWERETAE